ncbi:MAG TPA: type II toxin-antitoxin system PemK/MazF family toxin [Candidatus Paceibacterota bacterium]|nr:type II toxin-antitoxin system PemK/MazF family toxin [Candidatus Paceibacterota bacterium]
MEITKELVKIFVDWTKLKIRIHSMEVESVIYPKKREIWWASLGQNIGVEINGKNDNYERPVLIVKVFNEKSILVAPISSTKKTDKYLIEFISNEGNRNVVNISQLKMLSSKRLLRLVGEMGDQDFSKVKDNLRKFF